MIKNMGPCGINVDAEATRACYADGSYGQLSCDCAGCRNFVRAAAYLPEQLRGYLAALGVAADKPAHLSPMVALENGAKLDYTGWYYVCGTLPPDTAEVQLPDCSAQLSADCTVFKADLPRPLLQLDFYAVLPWVLDEPNPY